MPDKNKHNQTLIAQKGRYKMEGNDSQIQLPSKKIKLNPRDQKVRR